MNAPVFVDTNVFVYARDAAEPVKQPRAMAWLERLWRERRGRTSMQVLSEYYVTVTRKLDPGLPREDAWDDVTALLCWSPAAIDDHVLVRGREVEDRYRLGWWDSLVVAAAQLQGCAVLLTEDLQDRATFGGVTVRNPFTYAVEAPIAAYGGAAATSGVGGGHPRRGRPRK